MLKTAARRSKLLIYLQLKEKRNMQIEKKCSEKTITFRYMILCFAMQIINSYAADNQNFENIIHDYKWYHEIKSIISLTSLSYRLKNNNSAICDSELPSLIKDMMRFLKQNISSDADTFLIW